MSTRCQIGIYEAGVFNVLKPEFLLYRHGDGYPGTVDGKKYGVLQVLVPFLMKYRKKVQIQDVESIAAWCLYELVQEHVNDLKRIYDKMTRDGRDAKHVAPDGKDYLGMGICNDFYGDIEYYYAIQNNVIKVYKTNLWGKITENCFELIQTIAISNCANSEHVVIEPKEIK